LNNEKKQEEEKKEDKLEDMFKKMEITVLGDNKEEDKEEDLESDESDVDVNQSYIEDNRISQKHLKYTDLEGRA